MTIVHRRWALATIGSIAVIILAQFIAFKTDQVFSLNLKTRLYDNAAWIRTRPKVLIMGSSTAQHGIIPGIIAVQNGYSSGEVVNVGMEAATPFEMYTTFRKNREKFSNLRYVYYTVEPWILSEKYYVLKKYEKNLLNPSQWARVADEREIPNSYFFPLSIFLDSLTFTATTGSMENGYQPLLHKQFSIGAEGNLERWVMPLELFPISVFQINWLMTLKQEVESIGARFYFVITPAYQWVNGYRSFSDVSGYDGRLVEAMSRLGPMVILGSFDHERFGLTYRDFNDQNHLAHSGAQVFTRQLFANIQSHSVADTSPIKSLYLY